MLLVSPVHSAEQADPGYELGEIVVSAPGSGAESVANVTRISAQELKNMGARTLDEGLRFVPGLNVRIGGSGTPRIDIRGFRTRHVLLLVNGVPIKNTYDDQFDPTTIPIDYIREIKVNTGRDELQYRPGDKFSVETTYAFSFGLTARASLLVVADQVFYNDDPPHAKENIKRLQACGYSPEPAVHGGFVSIFRRRQPAG